MAGIDRRETTGADDGGRPSRSMDPGLQVFDIGAEGGGLQSEPQWSDGERNSKTLLKTDHLRVVLTALRAGAVMDNDDPDETVTIQGLQGTFTVRVGTEEATVSTGQLVCLTAGQPWRITAAADSLFVLSVARGSPQPASR